MGVFDILASFLEYHGKNAKRTIDRYEQNHDDLTDEQKSRLDEARSRLDADLEDIERRRKEWEK